MRRTSSGERVVRATAARSPPATGASVRWVAGVRRTSPAAVTLGAAAGAGAAGAGAAVAGAGAGAAASVRDGRPPGSDEVRAIGAGAGAGSEGAAAGVAEG